jgi:hypothetical protein
MQDYEKLELFFLGRPLDDSGQPLEAPLLHEAHDLWVPGRRAATLWPEVQAEMVDALE